MKLALTNDEVLRAVFEYVEKTNPNLNVESGLIRNSVFTTKNAIRAEVTVTVKS